MTDAPFLPPDTTIPRGPYCIARHRFYAYAVLAAACGVGTWFVPLPIAMVLIALSLVLFTGHATAALHLRDHF